MKKALLVTAVLALAVSAAACSKKDNTAASTTAAETTGAETTTAAETETTAAETETTEDVEEDYVDGKIAAIDGDVLTITSDDDGTDKKYDIADAEINQEFELSVGDWVEVVYPAETAQDPIPAISLEVLESVIGETTDPSVEGKIVAAATSTLTIQVDGTDYNMDTANAYIVGDKGIQEGKNATVTYLGDLDDTPMAVKVVMEDAYGSPEADINAFVGTVAQVGENGDSIVLEAENGDFFTFVSDSIDFSDYSEGQRLQISYTGSIGAKEIPAVAVDEK